MFLFINAGAGIFPENVQIQSNLEQLKNWDKKTVNEVVSSEQFKSLIVANEKLIKQRSMEKKTSK